MPESSKQGGTQADPARQPQAGTPTTAPTDAPATPQAGGAIDPALSDAMTLEEAKKLRQEHNSLRRRLAEYEQAAQAAADAQLSETEKLTKQLASLQEQNAALQVEQQQWRLAREIARHAPSLNLIDPDAASLMLQAGGELAYDDGGNPTNVEKLLQKLIAEKPYLVSSNVRMPPPPPTSGGATNPGRSAVPAAQPQPQPSARELYDRHKARQGLGDPSLWKR